MNKGRPWRSPGQTPDTVGIVSVGNTWHYSSGCCGDSNVEVTFDRDLQKFVMSIKLDIPNVLFVAEGRQIGKKMSCGSVEEIQQWVTDDVASTVSWLQQQDAQVCSLSLCGETKQYY